MGRITVLRRLLDPSAVNEAWIEAAASGHAGHACVLCGGPSQRVTVEASQGTIQLEVCRPCQSIWFDAGEFAALDKVPSQPPRDLPPEARLALAQLELKRAEREAEGDAWDGEPPERGWKWLPALLGFPIEVRDRELSRRPWATWSVALSMAAMTALVVGWKPAWFDALAWVPAETFERGGVTLVTGFLLHGGWWHLLGNAYFLLVLGDDVEDHLGPLRFLALVAVAEFGAVVAHLLGAPDLTRPVVGASGAISGVLTYYAVRFPRTKVGLLIVLWPVVLRGNRGPLWTAPVWFLLLLWALYQMALAGLQVKGFTDVAATALFGGAVVGLALGLVGRRALEPSWARLQP